MQEKRCVFFLVACSVTSLLSSNISEVPQLDEASVVQSNQEDPSNQVIQSKESANLVTVGDIVEIPAPESQPQQAPIAAQSSYENIDYTIIAAHEDLEQPINQKEQLREAAPEELSEAELVSPAMLAGAAAAAVALGAAGVGGYMVKDGMSAEKKATTYRRRSHDVEQEAAQRVQEKAALESQLKSAITPQERDSLQQKLNEATVRAQEVENRRQTAAMLATKYEAKRPTGVTGSVVRKIMETKATIKEKAKPITNAYKESKEQAKTDWRYKRGR